MPIPRPITLTKLSTADWGWPITDAVNANTAQVATNVTDIDALETTVAGLTSEVGWKNATNGTNINGTIAYKRVGRVVVLVFNSTAGAAITGAHILGTVTDNTCWHNSPAGYIEAVVWTSPPAVFARVYMSTVGQINLAAGYTLASGALIRGNVTWLTP